MEAILSSISTVGFPIVAWIITFAYMQKQEQQHKEEVNNLTNVVKELSVTISSLQQLLEDKL